MSNNLNSYESGMIREDKSDKVKFDLIFPISQKLENTAIYKFAKHLTVGAEKHGVRNWEKASGVKELDDFRRGAWRHAIQFLSGATDEDHASALLFNINAMIYLMDKLKCDVHGLSTIKEIIDSQDKDAGESKLHSVWCECEICTNYTSDKKPTIYKPIVVGNVTKHEDIGVEMMHFIMDQLECINIPHHLLNNMTFLTNDSTIEVRITAFQYVDKLLLATTTSKKVLYLYRIL